MVLFIILVIAALVAGTIGIFSLSDATLGVGIICLACLTAILARLAQAAMHQKELIQTLRQTKNWTRDVVEVRVYKRMLEDLGLTEVEGLSALRVTELNLYAGTLEDAGAALEAYKSQKRV
jgi:hypothetical protein